MTVTDAQASKLHERIDALSESNAKRFDELRKEIHGVNVTLTQYTTVTRRHVEQQQQTNAHLQQLAERHEQRLGGLEKQQAVQDATRPARMLGGDEIEARFEGVEQRVETIENQVSSINRTLAKHAAIAGGAIVAINVVAPPLIRGLWGLAFGG